MSISFDYDQTLQFHFTRKNYFIRSDYRLPIYILEYWRTVTRLLNNLLKKLCMLDIL